MAFCAMAQGLDEVTAADQGLGIGGHGETVRHIEQFPKPDAPADGEGEADVVRQAFGIRRGQCLPECPKIGDILRLGQGISGIGEDRIVVRALGRYAALHGAGELRERPCTDPLIGIHRDIGRAEGAEPGYETDTS